MGDFGQEAAATGRVADWAADVNAWLRGGESVVAASERAARAIASAFHRARRAEGLAAWPAPAIRDWSSFVRDAWQQQSSLIDGRRIDDRLVLSRIQEQALWVDIVGASGQGSGLLPGPRQRVAAIAMEAHALLCAYAPHYLDAKARSSWQQDAAAFSGWLKDFEAACRSNHALSAARVPLELLQVLEAGGGQRPPLLLVGFDRLLPVQRQIFEAWGGWSEPHPGPTATHIRLYAVPDAHAELAACAQWCRSKLAADPGARLLVVAQGIAQRRGEIERAFLRHECGSHSGPQFEFSLGVPLSSVPLPRGAYLVLRWLGGPLEEQEIDWLFSTGQCTTGGSEQYAERDTERYKLTGFMRALRRSDRQRRSWELQSFQAKCAGAELPGAWVKRMLAAKRKMEKTARRPQTPLVWAELVPELLENAGWPHSEGSRRPLVSAEFQAIRRWQQTVEECASLGFDGRRMSWADFLFALGGAMDETLFAPESHDAPIQIAGPAESAGLTADAIWFLGASDDAWPAGGAMHPFLPFELQREAAMPHASAQLDWELARTMTARLLASAAEVNFSYARQSEGAEVRASLLAESWAGSPQALSDELSHALVPEPIAVDFHDVGRIPLRGDDAAGGSMVLSSQSECPFKAFATARLGAQGWEHAQAGLTARQRGQLLHAVLHSVWGGPPAGIRTHAELLALADLRGFVEGHAQRAIAEKVPPGVSQQMPRRYLELEAMRLTNLVSEWLAFERRRVEFSVARTELDVSRSIAGLNLRLRLDRLDRLNDGSLLVIDYKTGLAGPGQWEMPRPEDVQLPLYAGFGLNQKLGAEIAREFGSSEGAAVGGLVFAKVRTGELCFAGRVRDAKTTLLPDLGSNSALLRKRFTDEELKDWCAYIERMAGEYIEGRAEVNPRDYPKTCERCDLQAVCRVRENRADAEPDGDEDSGE